MFVSPQPCYFDHTRPTGSSSFDMSSVMASASAAPTEPIKAPPQAGILEGVNPVHFDKNHPIILFIVQVCCLYYLKHRGWSV